MTLPALRNASPLDRPGIFVAWLRDREAMRALAASESRDAVLVEVRQLLTARDADALRARLRREIKTIREVKPGEGPAPCALVDVADGAPDLPETPGYTYSRSGIWRLTDDGASLIARRPIAVHGRYRDHDTGAASVDVGWASDGEWHTAQVARDVIADGRSLTKLAAQGAPVVSALSGQVAMYLSEQEHAAGLPLRESTTRCGWHGDTYQAGHTTIGPRSMSMLAEPSVSHLAAAVRPQGTWEGWLEALAPIGPLPHAWLGLYASLASALMRPCRVDVGTVVSVVGRRRRGKTTVIRLAASVWGVPAEVEGLIRGWDSTALSIEQSAALLSECCLILDDTSRVNRLGHDRIPQTIYMLANGGGRGRGNDTHHRSWRVVTLSTGEAPLRSYGGQEGAASRTIEVIGDPMPDASTAQAIEWGIADHFGHLGPRVIAYLQSAPQRQIREWYRRRVQKHQQEHPGHDRAARGVALLEAAARAAEASGLPKPGCDVWAWLWGQVERHGQASDQPAAAWEVYQARLAAEVAAGRWLPEAPIPSELVVPWLKSAGYVAESVITEWRTRGWVETESDGRLPRRGKGRTYVIAPTIKAPGGLD